MTPVPDQPFLDVSGGVIVGDGRPELLFGFSHHNGLESRRDDDPGDSADEVTFLLDSATASTTSGDSYTGAGDNTGASNCFRTTLVVDTDLDDDTMAQGPFVAYLTFTPTASQLDRMRALANSPGADIAANVILFNSDPGDDMILFNINVDDIIDPCNLPGGGFMPDELVEIGDITGGDVGESETDVGDTVAAIILGGRESFSFAIFGDPESPDEGQPFNTVRFQSAEGFNTPKLEITIQQQVASVGCYPDPFSNNLSNSPPTDDPATGAAVFEFLGAAIMASSENRDCDGFISPNRWERDTVSLDHLGQQPTPETACAGQAGNRKYGARWQSTLYDWVDHLSLDQPPIEDSFGHSVDSMPDIDNDQIGEFIISAPTLELDSANLFSQYGFDSTHLNSRAYDGSVIIQLGFDFNNSIFRETNSDDGNAQFPNLPSHNISPVPRCGQNAVPRALQTPVNFISIFAENINDRLGGARYAGDFNQDFSPDIIMGAPASSPPGTFRVESATSSTGVPTPAPCSCPKQTFPDTPADASRVR